MGMLEAAQTVSRVSEEWSTETGGNYYTLTYAPSNENYEGKLRKIHVPLSTKGYQLSYRRSYGLHLVAQSRKSHNAKPPALEISAAAFNADGQMLNGLVENSERPNPESAGTLNSSGMYRLEQQINVPLTATSKRIAVRDTSTDRIGAMEIPLPLAPEPSIVSTPSANSGRIC